MDLLALLLALALLTVQGSGGALHADAWFGRWREALGRSVTGAPLRLASVVLPALAVLLLDLWVGRALHGLAELVLMVVVLVYSAGRGNLADETADYLERWSRGDFQAAHVQVESAPGAAAGEEAAAVVTDPAGLHAAARRALYLRSFERLFPVLFWFVVAGPAGAFAYRLARLEAASPAGVPEGEGLPLVRWLDWVPARLLGISYALVGDFDACLRRWRAALDDASMDAAVLLEDCGNAALQFAAPAEAETQESLLARGITELEAVELLHRRALVVWLVLIALLAMIR